MAEWLCTDPREGQELADGDRQPSAEDHTRSGEPPGQGDGQAKRGCQHWQDVPIHRQAPQGQASLRPRP
eukprot:scaffold51626_cov31-Prasinocladus_malaysianus.AAC.1